MKKVLLLCDEIPKHHDVQLTHALRLFFHIFSTIANEDIQSIVRQKIYLQAILYHLIKGQISNSICSPRQNYLFVWFSD